jgi:hypothetical protein
MQLAGLNIDTSIFDTVEIRIAFDPALSSRFEFFWGTNSFPGPAGGQSIVEAGQLIRDGNMHTYRFDMSDEGAWDGNLNVLRIDPLADGDAGAGLKSTTSVSWMAQTSMKSPLSRRSGSCS